jgi:TnpA family transposase
VTNLKQAASDSKDFVQTEKLGEKEKILQEQLLKLEDQFSSEILQNSLTQWVQSYMNYVLDHITSPSKVANE